MTDQRKTQLFNIVSGLPITGDEISHYLGVASAFTSSSDENDQCLPVALFHDLVEDKYISMDELAKKARLNQEQIAALDAITRRPEERYFDYIARYAPYPKESILYRDFPGLIDEILKYLVENGKGLEINTKTYRAYGLRTPQLDRDILIRYMELGGDIICLGSDSHKADQVGTKFDYFAQYVKMFGFRRLGHFEGRRLKMVTI